MEPFQFLFLFAEEFLSLSLTPNLKRLAHQKHHQPRDHQEPYSESRGNHPKVLRIIPGLQCCQHPSRLPTPSSLPQRLSGSAPAPTRSGRLRVIFILFFSFSRIFLPTL